MKVMTSPSASAISFRTAFSRSSNSPRYLAPAIIEPMSRLMTRLPFRPSGTSPSTMRWARPSTMAVLPTPGSPIRTGLFLVRRDSTWMTRRTSSSRPMTGSIFPWRARAVRSRPYFSRAWKVSSGFCDVTRWLPRTSRSAWSSSSRSTPSRSASASSRCSTDRYSSPMSMRWRSAASRRLAQRPVDGRLGPAEGLGQATPARRRCGRGPRRARRRPGSGSARRSRRPGRGRRPAGGRGSPRRWRRSRARSTAAARASWVLRVQRSGLRVIGILRFRGAGVGWYGWGRAAATAAPGPVGTGGGSRPPPRGPASRVVSSSRFEPVHLGLELEDPAHALQVERPHW